MIISQAQAIRKLRTETGMSEAWCTDKVRGMNKVADGKREKVRLADVNRVVKDVNEPPPVKAVKPIRPLSESQIRRLRDAVL
jgi:GMP synthase PP-ATPase subunit